MIFWEAALWGGAGGLIVEILEFHTAITRTNAMPWEPAWQAKGEHRPSVLITSVVIRVMVGALFAGVMVRSGIIDSVVAAMFAGAGAPTLILEKVGQSVKGLGQQLTTQTDHASHQGGQP